MNRLALSFFVASCLVFAGFLHGFGITAEAAPDTIYVPGDYPTIQGAINAALDGDTIYVYNGTYLENIVVNKTVTLVGEGQEVTVITATNFSMSAVSVTSDDVSISGFTVNGATASYPLACGFYLESVRNVTISHNNVTNNRYGIYLTVSDKNTVSANIVTSNYWGINLETANQDNRIIDNVVDSNTYYGIVLWSASYRNVVANNTVMNNERGVTLGYADYNVIESNYIANNPTGIEFQRISNNNTIYRNSFIDNVVQVGGEEASDSANALDNGYPSGGNYWSDYAGPDLCGGRYQNVTGSDGIVDTPHAINANNTDRYPLMAPYVISEFAPALPLLFCITASIVLIAFHRKKMRFNAR